MKRALIHRASRRLCEVRAEDFPVHADLEWRDAPDDATPETHFFDGTAVVPIPPPSAEEIAERNRKAEIDNNNSTATFGPTEPKSVADLKAMTLAQYNAWFDANFNTLPQFIALIKRILLILIRRVL